MQKIAICDDDTYYATELETCCMDFFEQQCDIVLFQSGEALLESLYDIKWDIILLDIDMPGLNGLDVRDRLQSRHIQSQIIFVTGYENYMQDAFGIYVSGYLIKPVNKTKLFDMLYQVSSFQDCFRELEIIDIKNCRVRVLLNDIIYMQAERAYSHIYIKNQDNVIAARGIGEWEQALECYGFFRCHKSYLVNLAYVDSITNAAIIKCCGVKIPVSRSRRTLLREAYIEYQFKTARWHT